MATCNFCKEKFKSEQGVKAHMRRCDQYQTSKELPASGSMPKAGSTPSVQPNPSAGPDSVAPPLDFLKAIHEFSTKRETSQTPQQLRRSILQAVKAQVVDRYQSSSGSVTSTMRGDAKMAMEQQLASLPLEELPFDEVCELAAAIRDRLYAPTFKKEAKEAEQQHAEQELRRRKQTEETAAGHRAAGRKTILIEQAIGQARARCEAKQIVGRNRFSVLVNVESQLAEFLTGNESVPDANVIIQTVIDACFVEAEAKQDAARAKAHERWYEELAGCLVLGVFLAAPLLVLWYPTQALMILNWIERTFGLNRAAEAGAPNPEASETTPPTANVESRPPIKRRRKYPVEPPSPWTNSVGAEADHSYSQPTERPS
jgi:hypothetical protein